MNFNFSTGVVSLLNPFTVVLKGGIVAKRRHSNELGHRFHLGKKIFASWCGKEDVTRPPISNGQHWLDFDAIEPEGLWRREEVYIPAFQRDGRRGFEAEDIVLNALIHCGVRAEKPTLYEDQRLGVDFWVFLKIEGSWKWLPVDLTLRRGEELEEKYKTAFERGIIVVALMGWQTKRSANIVFSDFMNNLIRNHRNFLAQEKSLLKREEAKLYETTFMYSGPLRR
ncbi:MAG: hypothetical protein AAB392_00165 [Patescibacteria group bacterium]